MEKKLFYLVNCFNPQDDKHFVHVPNLLIELRDLGWEVEIISEKGGKGSVHYKNLLVTFLSNKLIFFRLFNLLVSSIIFRKYDNSVIFVRISKLSAVILGLMSKFGNYKVIYWVSGAVEDFNFKKSYLYGLRERTFNKLVFRFVDKVVTGPERMLDYYHSHYKILKNKLDLLYNDVDLSNRSMSINLRNHPDNIKILMIHNYSTVRETMFYFRDLLKVILELSNEYSISLDIVGGGEELAEMQNYVKNNNLSRLVCFYGSIPNEKLSKFYLEGDIFIMPSKREGFPRVILEAMSYGLPIISTDAGGVLDILGGVQAEYVSSIHSPELFSSNLARLIKEKSQRELLSIYNLNRVERYSTRNVAKMFNNLLIDISG